MNVVGKPLDLTGLGALVLVGPANIAYCCGFAPTPFERLIALVVTGDARTLIVPSLEEEAARAAIEDGVRVLVWRDEAGPLGVLSEALRMTTGPLGIERNVITLAQADLIRAALPGAELVDAGGRLADARVTKTAAELAATRRACAIADEAMDAIATVVPGESEWAVAETCTRLMREGGGDASNFPPIVLSGPRSALPHGRPGVRRLEQGDLLVVDFGASFAGYFSDITRTFVVAADPDARQRELIEIVDAATRAGIAAARPGAPARNVDDAARAVIDDAGYGQYFVHRTGHGLGRELHERPWLTAAEEETLAADMVITVEPGIYIPGYGGVRIEDDVRVADPPEVLTHARIPYVEVDQ